MYNIVISVIDYDAEKQVTDVMTVKNNDPNSRALIKPYLNTVISHLGFDFDNFKNLINNFISGDTEDIKSGELNVFVKFLNIEDIK